MVLSSLADKEHILKILEVAFESNPTMISLSKVKHEKIDIRPILEYTFHYSLARQGIYLSDDRSCVAFFINSTVKGGIMEKWYLIKLILTGVRINKILSICFHLKKIKDSKPRKSKYYHFWFLGSKNSNVISNTKFVNELLSIANEANLPVFAETTLLKNVHVFSRFGFNTYKIIKSNALKLKVFLMKKNVC